MKILWIVRQDLSCYVFYFLINKISNLLGFEPLTFVEIYIEWQDTKSDQKSIHKHWEKGENVNKCDDEQHFAQLQMSEETVGIVYWWGCCVSDVIGVAAIWLVGYLAIVLVTHFAWFLADFDLKTSFAHVQKVCNKLSCFHSFKYEI